MGIIFGVENLGTIKNGGKNMTSKEALNIKSGEFVFRPDVFGGIEKLKVVPDGEYTDGCVTKPVLEAFPGNFFITEEQALEQDCEFRVRYGQYLFFHI